MVLAQRAVGDPITAAGENEEVDLLNLMPGKWIVPTTTSSGVTVATYGLVSFSAVTEIICDAAFANTFVAHEVVGAYQSDSTLATATLRLRTSAPADITTATYDSTTNLARNATVASATTNASPGTSWTLQPLANKLGAFTIQLFNTATATETTGFMWAGSHADPSVSSTANGLNGVYITQIDDTACLGFKITFSAACSGWLYITAKR